MNFSLDGRLSLHLIYFRSRLLPTGKYTGPSSVNQAGVDYYNKLIDLLIANGIQPFITIFHWDTPQPLEDEGGWINDQIVDDYVDFASLLFSLYGDRVHDWITFNEPWVNLCETELHSFDTKLSN